MRCSLFQQYFFSGRLDFIKNIEELVKVNKILKDRNEELEMNILASNPTTMKRKGCHLIESPTCSLQSKVKKKRDELEFHASRPDTKNSDEVESENDEDDVISLSDIWSSFDQQYKVIDKQNKFKMMCYFSGACY